METLKQWARRLKREVMTVWFAARHPDMPWGAKLLALAVVTYAFSPIDLIPDFIPVLGVLDDILLVPVGVWLVLRLTPVEVRQAAEQQATDWFATENAKPKSLLGASLVVLLWLAIAVLLAVNFLQ